jgi:putative oxidoreductase
MNQSSISIHSHDHPAGSQSTLHGRPHSLHDVGHLVASKLGWLPPLAARLSLGYVFISSGIGKLSHLDKVIESFRGWGIPAPQFQAPFTAACELVFGALLLVGLFTRFAAVPLMIIMIVAMRVTAFDPAKAADEGTLSYLFGLMEYLYLLLLLWLAVYGGGGCSVDRIVKRGRRGTAAN